MTEILIPEAHIISLAGQSALAKYTWGGRGRAPLGYIKGIALSYGRVYTKLKSGDPAALDMAKKATNDTAHDALAWYAAIFKKAGLDNSISGVNTLRHLFVLLTGLGMRESSGSYCCGRDMTARNVQADTCEAGLFQQSFNSCTASPLLPKIFAAYNGNHDDHGYIDVFKEGVRCSKADLSNYGSGNGYDFQELAKTCPAFAVEFAAVGLRHLRKHWGPIVRREAQVRPEADMLFHQVEGLVDVVPPTAPIITPAAKKKQA
jgi:hypothetical protein